MKNAITLIELVFVIVLLGIISASAVMVLPKNKAITDAKHIASLLNEKRFQAQGNQAKRSCIRLNDGNLSDDEYTIASEIQYGEDELCYDWMGRVYESNTTEDQIGQIVDINISSQGNNVRVSVFPYTGYVKINN